MKIGILEWILMALFGPDLKTLMEREERWERHIEYGIPRSSKDIEIGYVKPEFVEAVSKSYERMG